MVARGNNDYRDEICLNIGQKNKRFLQNNSETFVKQGTFSTNPIENYDASFKLINGKLFINSKDAYMQAQPPFNGNAYTFFINPQYFENEITIGITSLKFRLIENDTKFEVISRKRDAKYLFKGVANNITDVVKFARNSEIFSHMVDDKMSSNHCYFGYSTEFKMFFVIDYGSSGQGSTNGTHVKIKDINFQIKKDSKFRILKQNAVDYQIEVNLSSITTKADN